MTGNLWTFKGLAVIAAVAALGCIGAAFATGLANPEPVPNAVLGPDWQCTRFALVFTTCSRVQYAASASVPVRKEPVCPRPRM
ncbi:hypothetical protein [Bradyrhizobium sp.]|uniref:hypothetical protein n=1 Tax=Bradyrhizobium sp. TaxID=376 RepID=UPI003C7919A1